jgi:hypothetical protein
MRYQLRNLYNQIWMPLKKFTRNVIRIIRKRDEDDNHFNNPFAIF